MDDVAGRTAFITGGAQGIGLGVARSLARAGVRLALADINADALEAAKDELGSLTEVEGYQLDVRDRDRYAEVADRVEARLGAVTLLVNNAGVAGGAPVDQLSYELWDWAMGINVDGVINGVQTFLPRIISTGEEGHIVNTASGAGLVEVGAGVLYTTSKFAVVGLSESLRRALARRRIGVSVLCPGPVATSIVDNSAALHPGGDTPADGASSARRGRTEDFLAGGTPIDVVGEQVLAGIRANRSHIYTDRMLEEPLRLRNAMLLDALSTATPEPELAPPAGG